MKIQDAMKLIAADSNKEMEEYITWALENRLDVVKSFEAQAEKGFKVFGNLVAEKRITKALDGTQTERWVITTRFTSNKGDVTWDVTTKDAIIEAVKELDGKAIPIRFGHGEEDYGAWTRFWTEEKDGVLYGYAEGELDQRLNKAQDLWIAIYEDGKKFATSYGARVLNFEWVSKDDGETYRLLTGISFKEISLTQMPANPDTTLMDKLEKHTKEFVKSVKKEIDEKPEEVVEEVTEVTEEVAEIADEVTEVTSESGDEAKVEEAVEEEAAEEVAPAEETSEEVEAEVAKSAEEEVATDPEEATQETDASEEPEEDESQSLKAQNAELQEAVKALSARIEALEEASKTLTEETKSLDASLQSIANSPRAFVTATSPVEKGNAFEQLGELMREARKA